MTDSPPKPPKDRVQPATQISPVEHFWKEHQPWLKEQGYELRPRYEPNWTPSWVLDPYINGFKQGDHLTLESAGIDARRVADNTQVHIKWLPREFTENEIEITKFFQSSDALKSDPRNHSVPVYDVLTTLDPEPETLLVLPFLLPWSSQYCSFSTIGEVVDFCDQIFTGLQFIHSHNIAHCDAKYNNVLMDGLRLFSSMPHPSNLKRTLDYKSRITFTSRTKVPVKYYFIDFGLSRRFAEGEERLVPGYFGGEKTVPEFEKQAASDPFAVDVYCIGCFLRRHFSHGDASFSLTAKKGFGFLKPLVESMCQEDPTRRPTMAQVVAQFETVKKSLSQFTLRSRIAKVNERPLLTVLRSPPHFVRTFIHMACFRPAIPHYIE